MKYVEKSLAMKYLANNENVFNVVKASFLENYRNGEKELLEMIEKRDSVGIYAFIHSLKGISLNLGSEVLYEDACAILEQIKKEGDTLPSLDTFIITFKEVYSELQKL